ncbi:ComEA family DNA-binding protein [Sediminicola sp. 1XM1-17]|uniref:ComEA family DNA-binding protein n=1 Tax=Sediminicola sp. 1XM1-17 TaxID=3127702 RepID=UPI003077F976
MSKKDRTSHFKFSKQERNGMFFLLAIILLLQVGYFYLQIYPTPLEGSLVPDSNLQEKVEELRSAKDTIAMYPFNPNFITDHKGYVLGMSPEEIDRLHNFRSQGRFVNTISDFQEVTQVSDSLLNTFSPYFKFPEWTRRSKSEASGGGKPRAGSNDKIQVASRDLNTVSADELKLVRGIGEKLSARIIKFRNRLGGFLVEEQLYDVYGLEKEVADRVLARFGLLTIPEITKIDLNTASSDELAQLVYIPFNLSRAIVAYRDRKGGIASFEELTEIQGFPEEKIDRIKLYLSL